jgi:hypothetical protein
MKAYKHKGYAIERDTDTGAWNVFTPEGDWVTETRTLEQAKRVINKITE